MRDLVLLDQVELEWRSLCLNWNGHIVRGSLDLTNEKITLGI